MGQEVIIRCDECGTIKKESNRWITAQDMEDLGEHCLNFCEMKGQAPYLLTFCGAPCFVKHFGKCVEEWFKPVAIPLSDDEEKEDAGLRR